MPQDKKSNLAVVSTFVGWVITLIALVWQVAVKDAQYSLRLESLESEVVDLDSRLDTVDAFQLTLVSDLAEIKTDLVWIRQQLSNMAKNSD